MNTQPNAIFANALHKADVDSVLKKMHEQMHRPFTSGDRFTRKVIQDLELTDEQIRRLSRKAMERMKT